MKKSLVVLLVLALFLLSSCSTDAPAEEVTTTPAPVVHTTVPPTPAPAATQTPTPIPTEKPVTEIFQKIAAVEETLLYESEKVSITLIGLEYGNYSVKVNLLLENNSDEELDFLAGTLGFCCNSVNQFMVSDGYMNSKITAGKKTYEDVEFDYSALQLMGISEIKEMCIGVEVKNDDHDVVDQAMLSFVTSAYDENPYTENAFSESIQSASHQATLGYSLLYHEQDNCTLQTGLNIKSKTVICNENGNDLLLLEATNNTDQIYGIAATDIALNGIVACDSTWDSEYIYPGKTCVLSITLNDVMDESIRNVFEIQEIGQISLVLEGCDAEQNDTGAKAEIQVTIPDKESGFENTGREIYAGNNLRIKSLGIVKDSYEYSDDLHWLLLVSNEGDSDLLFMDEYDSLSINGFMTEYSMYSETIPAKASTVIDVHLWSSGLEEAEITSIEEIEEIEVMVNISDMNWKDLDTVTLRDDEPLKK